jgi:hypothetical protein
MFSWTQQVRTVVLEQRLALRLVVASIRAPLVGNPQPLRVATQAEAAAVSWQRVQQHWAVQLALKVRARRLQAVGNLLAKQPPAPNREQRRAFLRNIK